SSPRGRLRRRSHQESRKPLGRARRPPRRIPRSISSRQGCSSRRPPRASTSGPTTPPSPTPSSPNGPAHRRFGPAPRTTPSTSAGTPPGPAATGVVDAFLSGVAAQSQVVWNVALPSAGSAQVDVANDNRGAPATIDRFETSDSSARFTTSTDLLRAGGPLPAPADTPTSLVVAFFYPW